MTKKEIKDLAKELLNTMNKTPLEMDVAMDDKSLDILSAKIIARLVQLKQLTNWLDISRYMNEVDWEYLDMTEEEELLSELAKLMTLMNLFTEKDTPYLLLEQRAASQPHISPKRFLNAWINSVSWPTRRGRRQLPPRKSETDAAKSLPENQKIPR